MRLKAITLSLLLMTGLGAGASQASNIDTGLIAPGNPLYSVEQVVDPFPMNPGEKAHESASEVVVADQKGLENAKQKAMTELENAVEKSNSSATNQTLMGLKKAQSVLQENLNRTPDQANQGLQTALQNIKQAKQNVKKGVENRPDTPGTGSRPDQRKPSSPGSQATEAGKIEHY